MCSPGKQYMFINIYTQNKTSEIIVDCPGKKTCVTLVIYLVNSVPESLSEVKKTLCDERGSLSININSVEVILAYKCEQYQNSVHLLNDVESVFILDIIEKPFQCNECGKLMPFTCTNCDNDIFHTKINNLNTTKVIITIYISLINENANYLKVILRSKCELYLINLYVLKSDELAFILNTNKEKPNKCNRCGMWIRNENSIKVICYSTILILVSYIAPHCVIKYSVYKYSNNQLNLCKIHIVITLWILTTEVTVMSLVVYEFTSGLPTPLYSRNCLLTLIHTKAILISIVNTKLMCLEIPIILKALSCTECYLNILSNSCISEQRIICITLTIYIYFYYYTKRKITMLWI